MRRGSTLLELVVTLTIVALLAGVVTLALRREVPPPANDPYVVLARVRRQALTGGRPVSVTLEVDGRPVPATATPDGAVLVDSALHVDRLSGQRRDRDRQGDDYATPGRRRVWL